HLRVVEEAFVLEALLQLRLERAQAEPARPEPSDQRVGEGAVRLDGELAGEVGLVVRRDGQHVLRADDVVRKCRGLGETGDGNAKHAKAAEQPLGKSPQRKRWNAKRAKP